MIARCLALAALVVSGAVLTPCAAIEEHDAAKAAVTTRATMPLETIIDRVVGADTQVLDAELERTPTSYRYRLKLLEQGHRVREVIVDGRTGDVVKGD
ncbi:MAG: PepSY domain-containing protein [Alphaproteobacteria bacterium]